MNVHERCSIAHLPADHGLGAQRGGIEPAARQHRQRTGARRNGTSMITAPPVELPEPQPVGGHDHRPVLMGAVRGSERRQQRCQPGAVRHHRRQVGRGQIRLSGSQQPTEREGESAARRTEEVLVVAPGETDPPVLRAVDALDRGDVIGQTGEGRVDRTAQMPGCSRPDCDAEKGSHESTRSMDTVVDSPVLCERRICSSSPQPRRRGPRLGGLIERSRPLTAQTGYRPRARASPGGTSVHCRCSHGDSPARSGRGEQRLASNPASPRRSRQRRRGYSPEAIYLAVSASRPTAYSTTTAKRARGESGVMSSVEQLPAALPTGACLQEGRGASRSSRG